jgi:hypothetical protein
MKKNSFVLIIIFCIFFPASNLRGGRLVDECS